MISLVGVTKKYRTRMGVRTVLDDISFTVEKGQHFGVLGRNGSGKSTLVRLLSGIETPTSGRIARDMSVSWPLAFAGSFQGSLSGLDNIRFVARIYGRRVDQIRAFVEDFSELGKNLHEPVKSYSSGMSARLAFALSLAIDFDCFLVDEIIAVGDARFQQKCHDELFGRRGHHAFVIVSHDPSVIRAYCGQAVVLTHGKVEAFPNVDDAYVRYQEVAGDL